MCIKFWCMAVINSTEKVWKGNLILWGTNCMFVFHLSFISTALTVLWTDQALDLSCQRSSWKCLVGLNQNLKLYKLSMRIKRYWLEWLCEFLMPLPLKPKMHKVLVPNFICDILEQGRRILCCEWSMKNLRRQLVVLLRAGLRWARSFLIALEERL